MSNRVYIQYSIDIDDLEEEMLLLYKRAASKLAKMSTWQNKKPAADLSGIEYIHEIRKEMAKIDAMLGDVQSIIEGYVRHKADPGDALGGQEKPPEQQDLSFLLEQFKKEVDNAKPDKESEKEDQ